MAGMNMQVYADTLCGTEKIFSCYPIDFFMLTDVPFVLSPIGRILEIASELACSVDGSLCCPLSVSSLMTHSTHSVLLGP